MDEDKLLTPAIKAILFFTIIILTGILVIVIGNSNKKALAPMPSPSIELQSIRMEILSDAKSV